MATSSKKNKLRQRQRRGLFLLGARRSQQKRGRNANNRDSGDPNAKPLAIAVLAASLFRRWRGPTLGVLLGLGAWLLLDLYFEGSWVNIAGPAAAVACGVAIGAVFDWFESMRQP